MPVASTSCLGRRITSCPPRFTCTRHSPEDSCQSAFTHLAEVHTSSSITRAYISSQSPILSLGVKTGQWSGNGR